MKGMRQCQGLPCGDAHLFHHLKRASLSFHERSLELMEIPLLVDAEINHAGVVDTESPQQHQEKAAKTEGYAQVARQLKVAPKDVSWHERGPRSGSHRSHYYKG